MMRSVPMPPMASGKQRPESIMSSFKRLLLAFRVLAVVALAAVVIKVAPTLARHAAGHSATYAGAAVKVAH